MKKFFSIIFVILTVSLLLSACGEKQLSFTCSDPLGCVTIEPGTSIKVGTLLTMSGPDSPYGIDALRGVEIAIAHKGKLLEHDIELVKVDDQCSADGGQQGATDLAKDSQIVGVIGATCSSASTPAAKILSDAGMVMISPSSTAPSLTGQTTHRAGFLRTIYNDKVQGNVVADFAFHGLGARTMVTIHDGGAYSLELQQAACDVFQQLGGECLKQIQIKSGQDVTTTIQEIALLNPSVLYYPVYTTDGVAITKAVKELRMVNTALISSDGLLSSDFLAQTEPGSENMYLSGSATLSDDTAFMQEYKSTYGENPVASYHAQAYDAAEMLFKAIEEVADKESDGTVHIPRQALRSALFNIKDMQGLSGTLSCSLLGECAIPNMLIYQVRNQQFVPVYP